MKKHVYTKDLLEPIVKSSLSVSEVLRKLDRPVVGGNYRTIVAKIKNLSLDTSHFTGALWSKGKNAESDEKLANIRSKRLNNGKIFVKNSNTKPKLRHLLTLGWTYKCNICGVDEWQGKPITLHIDHISGDHTDNRLNNLRLLCPNCHQQTDTWGNKKGGSIDYRHYKPLVIDVDTLEKKREWTIKKTLEKKTREIKNCLYCYASFELKNSSNTGRFCSNKCRYNFGSKNVPTKEQLQQDFIELKSFVQVGKKYSVSDNAVRKWCKKYEMN